MINGLLLSLLVLVSVGSGVLIGAVMSTKLTDNNIVTVRLKNKKSIRVWKSLFNNDICVAYNDGNLLKDYIRYDDFGHINTVDSEYVKVYRKG